MLEKLWVKNYRSLGHVEVDFGDLTVLVGLNGSGKSNLIDVLRFVSDALLVGLDIAVFKRMGSLRRWSANGRPYDVEIGLAIRTENFSAQYEFVLGTFNNRLGEYCVKRESCVVEKEGQTSEFKTEDRKWVKKPEWIHADIQSAALFLPILARIKPYQEVYDFLKGMSFYNIFPTALRERQKFVNPYPLEGNGQNFAVALFELERHQSELAQKLKSAINFVLQEIEDYQIDQAGGHMVVKLRHDYSENGQTPWFELAQESDGTLRMLGILMALYQEPPRTIIALEEPELTVHSDRIVRLWEEIEHASERSQIILTTHSPDLLDLCTVDQLRVVEKIEGITYIGVLDEIQRKIVQEHRFSIGQVLRARGQLRRAGRS